MTEHNSVLYFDVDDIQTLHSQIEDLFPQDEEPLPPFEQGDMKQLAFILLTIKDSISDHELYPTLEEKAAVLFYFINKKHIFPNGNKRMSVMCFVSFLVLNAKEPEWSIKELTDKAIEVAMLPYDIPFEQVRTELAEWVRRGIR